MTKKSFLLALTKDVIRLDAPYILLRREPAMLQQLLATGCDGSNSDGSIGIGVDGGGVIVDTTIESRKRERKIDNNDDNVDGGGGVA